MADKLCEGRFFWHELLTTDPQAAEAFYTRVVGWGTQEFEGSQEPYTMFTAQGQPVGGVMSLPEDASSQGAPPHWRAYLYTADIDGLCAKAEPLGGNILVPVQDIPQVGRYAVLQDPQGAVIGAITPTQAPQAAPDPAPDGHVGWNELATEDLDAAFDFYSALAGWKKGEAMDMGEAGIYQMFAATDEVTLGGIFLKPAKLPRSRWLYYFRVGDLDEAVGTTKALGGQVTTGPMEVPGGDRIAQCMDAQGAEYALISGPAA